jgi:hypothetical protein
MLVVLAELLRYSWGNILTSCPEGSFTLAIFAAISSTIFFWGAWEPGLMLESGLHRSKDCFNRYKPFEKL